MLSRLSTALQILVFLPLTLVTLSRNAFLVLSLFLTIHALIHGTLSFVWGSQLLSVFQVPAHSILLLVCFNLFSSSPSPWLVTASEWWGTLLSLSGPLFIVLEGLSSLLVVQKLGQAGKRLAWKGETFQFGLLILTAVAYVVSAFWIVNVSLRFPLCLCFPESDMCPVVSYRSNFTTFIDFTRRGPYRFCFPDCYWFCSSTNQHHRVIRAGAVHCL